MQKSTKIKYLQIYELRMRRVPVPRIADQFNCNQAFIYRAIAYCQSWRLDLSNAEEIQLLIDSKESRIRWLHDRVDEIRPGVAWSEVRETKDGPLQKSGVKIYPMAEGLFLREIRELEDDIVELKGLLIQADKAKEDAIIDSLPSDIEEIIRCAQAESGISKLDETG